MKKILLILALLFIADECVVNAQQSLLIRKKDKTRIGFSTSNIDSVMIASTDTLPASMFVADTLYAYKTVKVTNIPTGVASYSYSGSHVGLNRQYGIAQTATRIPDSRSSAVYNGFMFTVAEKLASISMYDMRRQTDVYTCTLTPHNDVNASGETVYNCAQASFGTLKYAEDDVFPLLYVSQRADNDGRCSVIVLRIVPKQNETKTAYVSFSVETVQTIFLPVASGTNGLYEARLTVDPQTGAFYVCSYDTGDANRQMRISQFEAVGLTQSTVTLSSPQTSYLLSTLDGKAIDGASIRGAFIEQGKLYVVGSNTSGGSLYVVDLAGKKVVSSLSLKTADVTVQPQGCVMFGNHIILIGEDNNLYTIYFS